MWRGCCASRRHAPPPAVATPATSKPVRKEQADSFCDKALTPELWDGIGKHKPVHLPQAASQLLGTFTLDRLMDAFGRGTDAGLAQAFKRGEPCMRESFALSYLDQATIRLSDAERFFQPLFDLCQELSSSFEYVTAKLVLEPPGAKSPAIVMNEDVIAIQLWGEQKLRLGRPTVGLPMTAPRPEPLLSPVLEAGDAVYLPQGVECRMECVTSSFGLPQPSDPVTGLSGGSRGPSQSKEPVLYLLLTVGTGDQSVESSLGMYITDLLRENKLSEGSDAFFRSAVTKRTLPERYSKPNADLSSKEAAAAQKAELDSTMKNCTAELISKMDARSFRKHFSDRMGKIKDAQREGAEKMLAAMAGPRPREVVTTKTKVRVHPSVAARCEGGTNVAHFKRGGETLSLPIAPSASYLIDRLSDGAAHVVATLPCDDPVERLCVCQILVPKGCIQVLEEDIAEEDAFASAQ